MRGFFELVMSIFFDSSNENKQPVHIQVIIYFCTTDGFFRILEKTSSELVCTHKICKWGRLFGVRTDKTTL